MKKKYLNIENMINENKDAVFAIKDSLSPEDIAKIDDSLDIASLMSELYSTYLKLEEKVCNLDNNFDDILVGDLKDLYIDKINNFKMNNYIYKKENIELIGYSITEFDKEKLKFRVNINCHEYKMINDKIVSGNKYWKLEQIILLSYEKVGNNWLISDYDKIYEKKLSN